ncbi:unnamed protein product, partial [Schistosoma curassoni]|uniref:CS domain-containing protein n=1 Tax=Schistosoma curassoni TaxID=6186 RepID=A0A183KRA4_9TREM
MMSASGDRFDWYQSEDNIWIDYLRKKMAPTDIRVEIKRREVSLYLTIPTGDELLKKFQLLHEVVPEDSSYRVTATKIEIKLKKADKVCWSHLESQDCITGSGIRGLDMFYKCRPRDAGTGWEQRRGGQCMTWCRCMKESCKGLASVGPSRLSGWGPRDGA